MIRLDLHNPAVTRERVVDQRSDLAGRDVGEDKLPPNISIAGNVTTRNIRPSDAGPVLHLKIRNAVLIESHGERGRNRTAVVVL